MASNLGLIGVFSSKRAWRQHLPASSGGVALLESGGGFVGCDSGMMLKLRSISKSSSNVMS